MYFNLSKARTFIDSMMYHVTSPISGRYGDLIQQYEVSLSRMLNDILILDQQCLSNQSDFPPIA